MIQQAPVSTIKSRSECNPYDENGFLPLITAPMYSVVDDTNYQTFLDNKIQVCLPRLQDSQLSKVRTNGLFLATSLNDFTEYYLEGCKPIQDIHKVCIDTANGNMQILHNAIRKAKEIHGDNLIIMAGNVASVEAFVELAKTGVDYIRVGIGGSSSCNTTSNTGVGQEDLEELIIRCKRVIKEHENNVREYYYNTTDYIKKNGSITNDALMKWQYVTKVKIVADGISTYVEQCKEKYKFNDNGYAAINKLLCAGADLVMIGKLFAQCVESAAPKSVYKHTNNDYVSVENNSLQRRYEMYKDFTNCYAQYSGMSTHTEQVKYKNGLKPSEGSVSWIPVRWTLNEWLNGSEYQDEAPYLMGYINSLKSAMSYTDSLTLNKLKQ